MLQDADPMKFSNYYLDGIRYFICDGEVYTNDETGARVKVDMLPSSIQMYGECVDDLSLLLELQNHEDERIQIELDTLRKKYCLIGE